MTKEKYQIEYDMMSTPVAMLWSYIATPNGLKEWFADDVQFIGKKAVFDWNGDKQEVSILSMRQEKCVRYHWMEDTDKTFFELKVSVSEFSDNTILTITDFSEPSEMEEAKNLWNYQIEKLQRILGCY